MLSKLMVEGVKSFAARAEVPFAPITLLTGTNSSGKSTLFQILLALKQTFEMASNRFAGIALNGKYIALGAYEDVSSGHRCGPITIRLGLTRSPHSSAWEDFRRDVKPWWAQEWQGAGEAISDQVSAELDLRAEQADSLPTVAAVSSFSWRSLNSSPAERHQMLYELSLTRAEPREDELPIPPRLPDDPPDPAGFPFRIELSQGFKSKESQEDDPESQPKFKADRAVVAGLQPTLVLAKTRDPASLPTLAAALAECVSIVRRNASPFPEEVSPFRKPASHVPPPDAVRSKLLRTKDFLSRCSTQDLVEFIEAYERFGEDTIRILSQVYSYYSEKELRREISQLLLTGLKRLVSDFVRVGTRATEHVPDSDLEDALRTLASARAPLGPVFDLIRSLFLRELPTEEVANLRSIVLRAATEENRQAVLVRTEPARQWLGSGRYSYGRERASPTELELQTYFSDFLFHLGPLRDEPKNLYLSEIPTSITDVGRRGERAIACLRAFGGERVLCPIADTSAFRLRATILAEAVTWWGKFLGIYDNIEINAETKYGTVCKVASSLEGAPVRADLTNVGVGVSQLLPIIVLCLAVPVGSTLLIEQPELHLHPSVQSRLAEFLAACALTGRQIVVETHSEHLVNGIRVLASLGRIQPERDVALSFIERDEYGGQVTVVPIARDGSITRWPRHFFDEAEQALSSLLRNKMTKG